MTSRLNIIVTSELPPAVDSALRDSFDVTYASAKPVERDLLQKAGKAFAVVPSPGDLFDDVALRALPDSIKVLATYSVGVDHIDIEAARSQGILVTNTPDVLTDATADAAMLLLLSAARGASWAEHCLRSGAWKGWRPAEVFGVDLRGRTLGVFGYGRIGQALATRARAFGMVVQYFDRKGQGPVDEVAHAVSDIEEFWATSDVISLHAPSTPETRYVINASSLRRMKKGVIIVNTARGDLISDDDLIASIQSDHVRAVGLDVFDGEPKIDPRYIQLQNATLLPHIGSSTEETRRAMGQKVLANLEAVARNATPPDLVV